VVKVLKPGTYKLANKDGEELTNAWNIQTATSLLSLASTSKSFVVNYITSTPVGDNHVNIVSLIRRATRLSPETQVTLRGYCGGHPPPKMVPFLRKKKQLMRAKYVFTSSSSKDSNGAQAA
jgi:hypothetical protein